MLNDGFITEVRFMIIKVLKPLFYVFFLRVNHNMIFEQFYKIYMQFEFKYIIYESL